MMRMKKRICKGINVRENRLGSGVYSVFFNYEGVRGSRQVGSFNEACKFAERAKPLFKKDPKGTIARFKRVKPLPTFGQMADRWLQEKVAQGSQSTVERYEELLRLYILPHIAKRAIDRVDTKTFVKIIDNAQEHICRNSLTSIGTCVSQPILFAIGLGIVDMADPTVGVLKAKGIAEDKKDTKKTKKKKS